MKRKEAKKPISLCDFVLTKPEDKNNQSKSTVRKPSQNYEKSQFGLSTLLHFNHNDTISSIRSQRTARSGASQTPSRFGLMMEEARKEIDDLRIKRIEMESQWKTKQMTLHQKKLTRFNQHQNEEQSYVSQQLDQSQVEEYSESIYKTVYPKYQHRDLQQDAFALQLKREILKGKLDKFVNRIKRYAVIKFQIELKCWAQLASFKESAKKTFIRRIFEEWKQVADRIAERQQIRQTILDKIKRRRKVQEFNVNIEDYL